MANKLLKTLNFGGNDVYDLAPNWKNVQDRPFGYETPTGGDTLTWDGTTSGLVNVLGILYHVSDATPTVTDGTIEINSNGTVSSTNFTSVTDMGEGIKSIVVDNMPMAIVVPSSAVGVTVDGLKFTKQGIYFRNAGGEYVSSLTINGCQDFPSVAPIPTEYLPSHLQFGVDGVKMVEILPPTSEFVYSEDVGALCYLDAIEGVEVGKTYTINYNGVDYECVGQELEGVAFGNTGILTGGEDTGEPFILVVLPVDMVSVFGMGAMIMPLDGNISPTISINGEEEIIKKLDNKYIDAEWMASVKQSVINEVLLDAQLYFEDGNSMVQFIDTIPNKIYDVNWDGDAYSCECKETFIEGEGTIRLVGNGAVLGLDATEEPFAILSIVEADVTMIVSLDGKNVVSIIVAGETIKKEYNTLNINYLPNNMNYDSFASYIGEDYMPVPMQEHISSLLDKGVIIGDVSNSILSFKKFPSYYTVVYALHDSIVIQRNDNSGYRCRLSINSFGDIKFDANNGKEFTFSIEDDQPVVYKVISNRLTKVYEPNVLISPSGKRYKINVDDNGNISTSYNG